MWPNPPTTNIFSALYNTVCFKQGNDPRIFTTMETMESPLMSILTTFSKNPRNTTKLRKVEKMKSM